MGAVSIRTRVDAFRDGKVRLYLVRFQNTIVHVQRMSHPSCNLFLK